MTAVNHQPRELASQTIQPSSSHPSYYPPLRKVALATVVFRKYENENVVHTHLSHYLSSRQIPTPLKTAEQYPKVPQRSRLTRHMMISTMKVSFDSGSTSSSYVSATNSNVVQLVIPISTDLRANNKTSIPNLRKFVWKSSDRSMTEFTLALDLNRRFFSEVV